MIENMSNSSDMKKLIEEIIKIEWAFFDKVKNEGGRAECQDDFRTFSIMRRSQYMAWSPAMLASWMDDLREALDDEEGRNPLTEKYGYMMCISEPDKNTELAKRLPDISEEKRAIAHRITEKLLPQNEAFRAKYPNVAEFKRRVLQPAINQVNEQGEFKLTLEQEKLGRAITHFNIVIEEQLVTENPAQSTEFFAKASNVNLFESLSETERQTVKATADKYIAKNQRIRVQYGATHGYPRTPVLRFVWISRVKFLCTFISLW